MSCGLYVQIVGRGMRLSPGKKDCLVLDFGGNVERHGPITAVRPKSAGSDKPVKNIKECPQCKGEVASYKRECSECGYEFPVVPREVTHEKVASRESIMGDGKPEPPKRVHFTRYGRHEKADKPPSMRVEYHGTMKSIASEWVCFEHGGYATQKAHRWWHERGGLMPVPLTVDEALDRTSELRKVVSVTLAQDGQYTRVVKAELAPMREPGCDDLIDDMTLPVTEGWGDGPPAWAEDDLPF
jgi:DNA repair protein RadD